MAEAGEFREGLAARIATFDRERARQASLRAEEERQQVLHLFPLESWGALGLEQYALGPDSRKNGLSFCRLMEYGTDNFGSIRGGSAAKHIIYQHRSNQWRVVPSALHGLDARVAWAQVRSEFVTAFGAADKGAYGLLDELESLSYGQALTTKALAVYFPGEFLPVFSAAHVRHFTSLLGGRPRSYSSGVRTWRANHELLELLREYEEFDGWSPHEVTDFLYTWHDPRPQDRVVWKIAPGERAHLWDDCLEKRRIRVGWDEVGSLSQYESDQELKTALDEQWPHSAGGNLRLARQLLAFRDLELTVISPNPPGHRPTSPCERLHTGLTHRSPAQFVARPAPDPGACAPARRTTRRERTMNDNTWYTSAGYPGRDPLWRTS